MDWAYISGFFDGEGNISVSKISRKQGKIRSYQVLVRFYNSDLNVLEAIREFLGCGKIYKKSRLADDKSDIYELTISSKPETHRILSILSKSCICKKEKIDYILKNFNFGYDNNSSFNIDEFHSLTLRKNTNKFYVKKELESFNQAPCPVCSKLFVKSPRRTACSESCREVLKVNKVRLAD